MKINTKFVSILSNKYFKFGIVTFFYLVWAFWVGSWWLLLGVPILFDSYVTKKVNWTFWKKREGPNSKVVEWIDALIFAVVAVTLINIFLFQNYKIPTGSMEKTLQIGDHLFVSKLKYGPKLPNTPVSFPFAQHTMPFTENVKSYLEWIQWPYKRLSGITTVKRDDIVVFNFPEGDTVIVQMQASSYYMELRRQAMSIMRDREYQQAKTPRPFEDYINEARRSFHKNFDITVRPVDKRDNYIKRCVALPGDTLEINDAQIVVNRVAQPQFEGIQFFHIVQTDGSRISPKTLEKNNIYTSDVTPIHDYGKDWYGAHLTSAGAVELEKLGNVISITKRISQKGEYNIEIFPHDKRYPWNLDNFGPLWIPEKDATIKIDTSNICIYERIITAYEGNKLTVKNGEIFINDQKTDHYTFKMNYYWMMGDNRHDSLDSRFWGFVPEDHIVGAPRFVWLSLHKEKKFLSKIQFGRMFRPAGR